MKDTISSRQEMLVDWSAAVWAGIIAGTIWLIANLLLTPVVFGGSGWILVRLLASIVLGESILAPPASFDALALVSALFVHYGLSILFTVIVAFVLHRWGLWVGILGGALMGLALYAVNFYSVTFFFPQFFALAGSLMLWSHVLFGAMAGGIYEALEVETYQMPAGAAEVTGS